MGKNRFYPHRKMLKNRQNVWRMCDKEGEEEEEEEEEEEAEEEAEKEEE